MSDTTIPTLTFESTVPSSMLGPEAVDYGERPKIISYETFNNSVKVIKLR